MNGLKRLEYRGYDSAGKEEGTIVIMVICCLHNISTGIAVDSATSNEITIIKKTGKVALLEKEIHTSKFCL